MRTESGWMMPEEGIPLESLWDRLRQALNDVINYLGDETRPPSFPGTAPLPESVKILAQFAARQPNNLGFHTKEEPSEMGFGGTQKLEKDFIYSLAHLLGAADPERQIDGYITSGGTAANGHAFLLARNKFWRTPTRTARSGIVVLASFLSHYSAIKCFGQFLGTEPNADDPNIFQELPTDAKGELVPRVLENYVRVYHRDGYRRFVFFLNAGTINMGGIDPVADICNMVHPLEAELGIRIHVHVDAAFGGYVIPFLYPDCHFAFHNEAVDTVTVDAHKMGYTPYPAGVFLCRKGDLRYTETQAEYIYSHVDHTMCGSRSGAIAAACWTAMHVLGWNGYRNRVLGCMESAEYLRECVNRVAGFSLYPGRINIVTAALSPNLRVLLAEDIDGRDAFWKTHLIAPCEFPADLTEPEWKGRLVKGEVTALRFIAMPHFTRAFIDKLILQIHQRVCAGVV